MEEQKSNIFRRFLWGRVFENIYHFLALYAYLILSVIGIGLVVALLLFFLELLFPKTVHVFNYALTDKTFTELYGNHHYHAAIFIAEDDTTYSSCRLRNIVNRDMLRECYTHIGEYSKAERIIRENMWLMDSYTAETEVKSDTVELATLVFKAVATRDLFRLYEKMGDRERQMEAYDVLTECYNNPVIRNIEDYVDEMGGALPVWDEDHPDAFSIGNNLKYDIICGMYYTEPDNAVDSITQYLEDIWMLPKFSASQKLTILNRLISWHLERGELFKAHTALLNGIEMAKQVDKVSTNNPLGEFAEYCYILHDKKNAQRFMNIYLRYMDKYYDDTDLEYLLAEMRYIKYSDEEIGKKVAKLEHCCEGIREQISMNFAGMTSDQQEYFAEMLEEPFSYALRMMAEHPDNKDLVELCFENEVFRRGLLMRTDVLLRQALAESSDTALLGEYDKYIEYKQELIAREGISGPGNSVRKAYLKSHIKSLEKRLADGCADISRENYAEVDVSRIKSTLDRRSGYGSLVVYVEVPSASGTALGAFVLNIKNGLHFRELCSPDDVEYFSEATVPVYTLCRRTESYKKLFSGIEDLVDNGKFVLYSPTGIVHRIPMSALYTDNSHTLGEKYRMTVVANPIEIEGPKFFRRKKSYDLGEMQVAMWGGIDYGVSESGGDTLLASYRSVLRGKQLLLLDGSLNEVNDIEKILKDGGVHQNQITKYTGSDATEKSFKAESGKANVIHISTHGFFNEDKTHEFSSVMHNAGLFFANANRTWMNDYVPLSYRKGYEDGILRAEEIETQNLASCDLVVLSACETGLGEIKGDEGVFGLQRAFKLAGAKCIIMSLWSVPDNATKELMNRFYSNLVKTRDIDDAFTMAQRSMKHTYDVRDWGGFVILH